MRLFVARTDSLSLSEGVIATQMVETTTVGV